MSCSFSDVLHCLLDRSGLQYVACCVVIVVVDCEVVYVLRCDSVANARFGSPLYDGMSGTSPSCSSSSESLRFTAGQAMFCQ